MKARSLLDIPGTDIKSGDFFETDAATVAAMVAAGDADDKATEADVYGENAPKAKVLNAIIIDAPVSADEFDAPKPKKK